MAVAVALVIAVVVGAGSGYVLGVANPRTVTSVSTTTAPAITVYATTTQIVYSNYAECDGVTSCSAKNLLGLAVTLSINTTRVISNGTFRLEVSEYNPTPNRINLSVSDRWALDSFLSFYQCYSGDPPYGASIFRGYYTLQNISSAKPVDVTYQWPIAQCGSPPNGPVTGFTAPPSSGVQAEYQNLNHSVTSEPFSAVVYAINGSSVRTCFPNGQCLPVAVYTLRSSEPAVYTIAGGDAWGALVLLHFSVASKNP